MKFFKTDLSIVTVLCLWFLVGSSTALPQVTFLPICDLRIEREAYDLVYNGQHRLARWVHEYLTQEKLDGKANRRNCYFQLDPLVPPIVRATLEDYRGSGFDRGHLCPADDATYSDEAMSSTFYLSNITPQCSQFNRGYWVKLEKHVRDLTRYYSGVHVFTGPLFMSYMESDGKQYVKYQVIGENEVAVPTHYFKVVFDEKGSVIQAYILPNEAIASEMPLDSFKASIDKIEKISGIVFNSFFE